MAIQRVMRSRIFLAIVLVTLTHFATTYYFTRTNKSRSAQTQSDISPGELVVFKESRVVAFPSNPDYQIKKSPDTQKSVVKKSPDAQTNGGKKKNQSEPLKSETLKQNSTKPVAEQTEKKSIAKHTAQVPNSKVKAEQSSVKEQSAKEEKIPPEPLVIEPLINETAVTAATTTTIKPKVEAKSKVQLEKPVKQTNKQKSVVPPNKPVVTANQTAESKNKLILAWTSLTSKKPMWGIKNYSFLHCPYSNCLITSDRTALAQADLLIFRVRQLRTHPNGLVYRPYVPHLDFSDMPPVHKSNQLWMDINQESPIFTHADEEIAPLNGVFNLSCNYLLDSDYSISYIPVIQKKKTPTAPVNYAAGKTKMALWFVSHCNAFSGRDQYVEELKKHNISVDIFGKCSGKSDGCSPKNTTCFLEVRKKYKFYLAFENSICKEYITEKFWNTLTGESYNIPIALGAKLEEYEKFSPPNSYLHTRNFTSPKALAQFMHRVDKDDSLFNSYHKWRETHDIVPRYKPETLHCYMCRQANEKKDGNPIYKNISNYWSMKQNCDVKPEPIT